jgi:hypothetical protein
VNADDYTRRICDSLQRIGLSADVRDDGQSVHINLTDRKVISVSYLFLRMADRKQLDYRVRYGAGLVKEEKRER